MSNDDTETRIMVRNLVDDCVTRFLSSHGAQIDSLDMDKQLLLGDRVRQWKQNLEQALCQHLATHDEVGPDTVRQLVREAGDL